MYLRGFLGLKPFAALREFCRRKQNVLKCGRPPWHAGEELLWVVDFNLRVFSIFIYKYNALVRLCIIHMLSRSDIM